MQDFPDKAEPTPEFGPETYYLARFFAKNCMKLKENWSLGEGPKFYYVALRLVCSLRLYYKNRFVWYFVVANPRSTRDPRPHLSVQILLFSCIFWQNFAKKNWRTSLGSWRPGNPGSATALMSLIYRRGNRKHETWLNKAETIIHTFWTITFKQPVADPGNAHPILSPIL